MGGITQAMAKAALQAGAEMRTGVEVARVLIDQGEAAVWSCTAGK